MQNSTLNLDNARAPKPPPPGTRSDSAQRAGAAAREKGLQRIEGMKIAQAAVQGIGMSTKEIRGTWMKSPNYTLAVSMLFTRATSQRIILGKDPGHVLSTSLLYNSLLHDSRFMQVPMSQATPGDIIIEPTKNQTDGYAGIVVDHGRIVSDSSTGVRNNSSLAEIQRHLSPMVLFRYIGVQKHPGYTLTTLANAGFNPDEPRLPAGQPGGGQWTSGGATGAQNGKEQMETAPSSPAVSGADDRTPDGSKSKPSQGLTDAQRILLRQRNAEAAAIIAKYGDKGEKPDTPESVLNGPLKSGLLSNWGWVPGTNKWDLRQKYKGYSDEDIALIESARRNGVRALAALAQADKLSKSQVTALQLKGMGVLADATLNIGLALAPYESIATLGAGALLGTTEGAIGAGAGKVVGSATEKGGIEREVVDGGESPVLEGQPPNGSAANATGNRPLQKGDVTTYQNFVDQSAIGDNLEGHELWQHANMNEYGLTDTRLSTPASQKNPVIVLDKSTHAAVNAAQKANNARQMTPGENITTNAQILRSLKAAPPQAIDKAEKAALEHAGNYGY